MSAVVISIGDELVLGQTTDTNASWLSARLTECGVMTEYHLALPDNKKKLVAAILEASEKVSLVLISGGLGPTPDDITRQAIAEAMCVNMFSHAPSLERIKKRFENRGVVMPESCAVQAMIPVGAKPLVNSCGTAPGLKFALGRAIMFVVPGVPSEMRAMFNESIMPELLCENCNSSRYGGVVRVLTLNTFGCGESEVAAKLQDLMDPDNDTKVGTTVADGIVSVRIRSECVNGAEAEYELRKTRDEVLNRLGTIVFSEGPGSLQSAVGDLLRRKRKTVATAESCTSGLLGKMLTDPPGASEWYLGGWIVYADGFKRDHLGVPDLMLKNEGAVSEAVVTYMAKEVIKRSGADYSLAITGIAGPDGATSRKPIGSVWIALGKKNDEVIMASSELHIFPGNRDNVRDRSAKTALNLLRLELV